MDPQSSGLFRVSGRSSLIWLRRSAALGTRVSTAERFGPYETNDPELLAAITATPPERLPPSESFLSPAANHASPEEIDHWSRGIVSRGWPFLAATYSEIGPPPTSESSVISGAIEMPNPYRGSETAQFIGHLPYHVLPLGMFGNIATGAAAGILASLTFSTVRARRRRGKGLCPTCAYPLTANVARCPECGTPAAP